MIFGARLPQLRAAAPQRPYEALRGLSGLSDSWDDRAVGDQTVHGREPYPAQLAVENERLQRALRARLREEEALRRVATLVAREHEPGAVLALVTEEVGRHLEADTAVTVRYDAPGLATFVATWTGPHLPGRSPFRVGRQFEVVPRGALARVQETGEPARIDSYEGVRGSFAEEVRQRGIQAVVAAPILVDGQLWGAFTVGATTDRFAADAQARLGAFAELVAQAIANVDARTRLQGSRARIVAAAADARRRIERDLHDGAQQRLVAVALSLQLTARTGETGAAPPGCTRGTDPAPAA